MKSSENTNNLHGLLWGPYIHFGEIDSQFAQKLLNEGKKLTKSDDFSRSLVSKIDKTLCYKEEKWLTYGIMPHVKDWISSWNRITKEGFSPHSAQLTRCWINFQNSGEYNPVHTHEFVDLSFVIYLQVPLCIKDEYLKFQKEKSDTGCPPGSIVFSYGEYNRFSVSARNILPRENKIIMWPSYVRHEVPAFHSEGTRISVAGNIRFLEE